MGGNIQIFENLDGIVNFWPTRPVPLIWGIGAELSQTTLFSHNLEGVTLSVSPRALRSWCLCGVCLACVGLRLRSLDAESLTKQLFGKPKFHLKKIKHERTLAFLALGLVY